VWRVGIPIKHRALLGIPAAALIDRANRIIAAGVSQNDLGRIVCAGHAILKTRPQRQDMAAVAAPGDVLNVANVVEEMVARPRGDLPDLE